MIEKKLVIIGAGGLAREILYASQEDVMVLEGQRWKPLAFVVDPEFKTLPQVEGIPVVEFENVNNFVDTDTLFIIAVGDPVLRQSMYNKL